MNEQDFAQLLQHLLQGVSLEEALECAYDQPGISEDIDGISTRSFREAMVLTSNEGLVVTMPCGTKFQVTVVEDAR